MSTELQAELNQVVEYREHNPERFARRARRMADGFIDDAIGALASSRPLDARDCLRAALAVLESSRASQGTCDHNAKRGTGTGRCDRPTDEAGYCDRAADHID